jgi:SAM-dependent methyltransferase
VNAPLWRYTHEPRLAEDEDIYFRGHPLFETDARILAERFAEPGPLVDLGCGAGRHSLQFARRGFEVVAVDLSRSMLKAVRLKARGEGLSLRCVQANLCQLGCLPDARFAYALSMFSTLGMIRGRAARQRALAEAHRVLRPGGRLALHAHNFWLNLRDAQGRFWMLGQGLRKLVRGGELGDRQMTYRGIPQMAVHLYRWPELRRELHAAGFQIDEIVPIDAVRSRPIAAPWLAHTIRAGGWLVFARRGT